MSQLEISSIRRHRSPRLGHSCLDAPVKGNAPRNHGIHIDGWVLPADNSAAPTALLVFCQGSLLRTAPIALPRADVAQAHPGASPNCGFSTTLTSLELPADFEFQLTVVLANGELVPLATINGNHSGTLARAPASPPGDLQPLMITSLGRTGTTYLMRTLAEHPQIAAERVYPYETNASSYWMHLLRVLIQPESSDHIPKPFDRGDWAQPPFAPLPTAGSQSLAEFLDNSYWKLAATMCGNAIEGFYRQVAAAQNQPQASYFCEKFVPNGLQIMLLNLYPAAKEIFLVRDFRDVVCSILAFNKKRGFNEFGRDSVNSDESFVPELRKAVERLLENYRARKNQSLLIRYEDALRAPHVIFRQILNHLALDSSDAVIESIIAKSQRDDSQLKEHRTSASPDQTIGRWTRDATPAFRQLCREQFDPLLPEFGYQLNADGTLRLADAEAHALDQPTVIEKPPSPGKKWFRRWI